MVIFVCSCSKKHLRSLSITKLYVKSYTFNILFSLISSLTYPRILHTSSSILQHYTYKQIRHFCVVIQFTEEPPQQAIGMDSRCPIELKFGFLFFCELKPFWGVPRKKLKSRKIWICTLYIISIVVYQQGWMTWVTNANRCSGNGNSRAGVI